MFLASEGETAHGCVYGLLDREAKDIGHVGGMWVNPEQRRKGIGRLLLQAVVTWAQERRMKRLELWAPAHHLGAIALYRQAGFCETGSHRSLPTDKTLQITQMQRDV